MIKIERAKRGWAAALLALSACVAQNKTRGAASKEAPLTEVRQQAALIVSSSTPELSPAVSNFGAVLHQGALYAFGGYFGPPNEYAREGQSGTLLRIDVDRRAVQVLAEGPGIQGAPLVSSSRGLLRVAGMRAENVRGEPENVVSLDDVARFDAEKKLWQPLFKLPQPRSSHAAVVLQGKLYVIGGFSLSGLRNVGVFNQDMQVVDLASGQVRSESQPFRARAVAAGVLHGKLVVVGGLSEQGKLLRETHIYDPESGTWREGAPFPEDALGIAVTSTGQQLYASGQNGVVYALQEPHEAWRKVTALAFPRFFHQLVALDEQHVAALGGMSGLHPGDRVSHVEILNVQQREPRLLTYTLRNPSRADRGQGVAIVDDALVVFGGMAGSEPVAEGALIDLASFRKQPIPALPVARAEPAAVALEGQLLALGGLRREGQSLRPESDGYLLDLTVQQWVPHGSKLPKPRTDFALIERAGELWAFGGRSSAPAKRRARRGTALNVLHGAVGEPLASSSISLPRQREAFGGALLGDTYYLVGGRDAGGQLASSCEAFDFASSAFATIPCPGPRVSPQLAGLQGKLYLAGGQGPTQEASASLEMYDPALGQWSTVLERLPIPPGTLHMRAYRHALVLFSTAGETAQLLFVVPPL